MAEGKRKLDFTAFDVTDDGEWLTISGSGSLVLIADTELGSAAASIDFSSIPAIYKHLLIVFKGRTDRASQPVDQVNVRFNNDSGSNYDRQQVQTVATTTTGEEGLGETSARALTVTASTASADRGGSGTIWIPDYLDTTFHKQLLGASALVYGTTTGTAIIYSAAGGWRSTAAVNRVTLISRTGSNFIAGTRATLYGLA